MKKASVVALVLVLLIPLVLLLGGVLSNLINPEIAAGHPNYARNFQLLSLLKMALFFGSVAVGAVLWMIGSLLVIRSRRRSKRWLALAGLGPIGFAVLSMLNERVLAETDWYSRFVRRMNWLVRVVYEVCTFFAVWVLAYQAMVVNRQLIIWCQAIGNGVSPAQVMQAQNASGGMWAFSEGLEVMFLVVLFYVLRPLVFDVVGYVVAMRTSAKAG